MSKSYRGPAEIEDWASREARRQHKRKSEQDWRKEWEQEMSDVKYIIVEEYEPEGSDFPITEILPHWYDEKADALEALAAIAEGLDSDYTYGELDFLAPPERGIERDTYYIMELDRG